MDASDNAARRGAGGRPLRVLFFMLHAGYIRFHRPTIEVLAARGHDIHLAFTRIEKDPGDAALAHELAAATPRVTFGDAPMRPRSDVWRALASLERGLIDLARYVDPRYAGAHALRTRMATKITQHVREARAVDPVTSRIALRLIEFLRNRSSARLTRTLVRALSLLEQAIPPSPDVDAYLRAQRPDVVLVTPLVEFASTQVEYVKSARSVGIPCALAVASWDNLTGKGLIRVLPDRVVVWNEVQAREAVELHGVPRAHVLTTGAPKFDEWFERAPSGTRADISVRAGVDPEHPFVLYVCSSPFIAPDEVPFVERWLGTLRANDSPAVRELGVIVRPHPQNAAQWNGVDLSRFGNVSVWPPHGAQPDAGEARANFFDSLAHSAAVVGINTSALIEAAIAGKSVLTPLAPEFSGTQTGTLHFRYLLFENGGFLHVAGTLEEHARQLHAVLEHGDAHAEQTRRFVASFVRPHGLDRPAAPIAADAVEAVAALRPVPARTGAGALALRAALIPLVALATLAGRVARGRASGPEPEPV